MMNNNYEEEYKEYREICEQMDAAEKADDNTGVDEARAKMHELVERVEVKGADYERIFRGYKDARDSDNEYIDVSEVVWDEKAPAMIESLRNLGIDHFTFSSTWTSAVETAWLFIESGCTLEGMVQINGSRDWKTGEYEKKPAYLFSIQ